ncbi:hypothetical protein D3875_21165 [Deinococcus cavernae]|uniref:Uncharacterized protein n=1 Tax=Deinococcus cavernae TaxID=2320857 RepID=A0A418UZJ6_9DEIO|nr:hypothetical protein [Deinococcus cavernae]RJF68872.1 hypothetical protein D3875_21165 [Deinococcus cavernae]
MTRHGMTAVTFEELISAGDCWDAEELRVFSVLLVAARVASVQAAVGMAELYAIGGHLLPVGRALLSGPRSRLTLAGRDLLGMALAEAVTLCGALTVEAYVDDYATEPEEWLIPQPYVPRNRQRALWLVSEALVVGWPVAGLTLKPVAPDVLICDVGCRARRLLGQLKPGDLSSVGLE